MPDPFEPMAQAIREERNRVCNGLIKLRHALLGKAHAIRSTRTHATEAYEEAATMVANYIQDGLGRNGKENGS